MTGVIGGSDVYMEAGNGDVNARAVAAAAAARVPKFVYVSVASIVPSVCPPPQVCFDGAVCNQIAGFVQSSTPRGTHSSPLTQGTLSVSLSRRVCPAQTRWRASRSRGTSWASARQRAHWRRLSRPVVWWWGRRSSMGARVSLYRRLAFPPATVAPSSRCCPAVRPLCPNPNPNPGISPAAGPTDSFILLGQVWYAPWGV